ncbi:MAG: hypothetical protein RLP02_33970 [Coleofasciculus sp. C2-GNP5-27]
MSKNLMILWEWAMGNGQWAMGNGQWAMGNGKEFQSFFLFFDFSQPI